MSRVGKQPIVLPDNVKVNILPDKIEFEGPKGKLASVLFSGIKAKLEENQLILTRSSDSKEQRSLHGLSRSLAYNSAVGVSKGFSKQLEIFGVGYKAKLDKGRLELSLGYSKPIVYQIPKDIEVMLDKSNLLHEMGMTEVSIECINLALKLKPNDINLLNKKEEMLDKYGKTNILTS